MGGRLGVDRYPTAHQIRGSGVSRSDIEGIPYFCFPRWGRPMRDKYYLDRWVSMSSMNGNSDIVQQTLYLLCSICCSMLSRRLYIFIVSKEKESLSFDLLSVISFMFYPRS
jgi:hypothetical protein